jgi:hypothetical protein
MSYYILPKIHNEIIVNPITSLSPIDPYISHSIINYYNEINEQIIQTIFNESKFAYNSFDDIIHIIHPYEYLYSKINGSNCSVSKIKTNTNLFYDFLEISLTLNIFDNYPKNISMLHITNNNDTIRCIEILRSNFNDSIDVYDSINEEIIKSLNKKYDFLFFETKHGNINEYIHSFIEIVMVLIKTQSCQGSCIIKIKETFHKQIIEILYLLSSLYEKTYILKPVSSNITSFDKYIICTNFSKNSEKNKIVQLNYFRLLFFLKNLNSGNIACILDIDIPYYFITKINDINVILGQQQIETLDNLINICNKLRMNNLLCKEKEKICLM